ncbi:MULTISPECIES: hypothetical protein [unclassified Streptomyces]
MPRTRGLRRALAALVATGAHESAYWERELRRSLPVPLRSLGLPRD